jgi:hypothetical protein
MTTYRFLWLSPDNSISQIKDLTLADEEAAQTVAAQLLAQETIEVWQSGRLVLRLDPASRTAH